jgi:hypothetical protein
MLEIAIIILVLNERDSLPRNRPDRDSSDR